VTKRIVGQEAPPDGARIAARTISRARTPLYRNALVLMGNTGITAGLGFVFWALAARNFQPAQVGLASAAISSALFAAAVSQLGLPVALVRFSPSAGPDRATLTTTVVVVATLAGAIAGGIFVATMNLWAAALSELSPGPELAVAIITIAAATNASTVLIYVAIGARDARPALAGGVTQGAVKSALVLVFAVTFAHLGFALVVAWLLGTGAAVLLQVWALRSLIAPRIGLHLLRLGSFLRYSAGNYVADLAWTSPGFLFPLIVVAVLGAEANAYFYIAWAIAALLAGIPTAVASSLLAEGSHDPDETGEHLRRAIWLTLGLVTPAIVVFWIGAPLLLGLFGAAYAAEGVDTLRLLSLAALPLSLNMLYITVARLDHALRRLLAIATTTGVGALLLGAALAPQLGTAGIALGYLAVNTVVAVVLTAEWWLKGEARSGTGRVEPPTQEGNEAGRPPRVSM
jgi:O-antigen/teichoic acid export membrane protein